MAILRKSRPIEVVPESSTSRDDHDDTSAKSNGVIGAATTDTTTVDVFDPHNLKSWSYISLYGCLAMLVLSGTLKTLTTQLASDQGASHTSSFILIWINYGGQWMFGYISKRFASKAPPQPSTIHLTTSTSLNGTSSNGKSSSTTTTHTPTLTSHTLLVCIAALDVIGCIFCLVATVLIGSGLYQVLYASILVMIALLSQGILGYKQNAKQWICLIGVTVGLWACSIVSNTTSSSVTSTTSATAEVESHLQCTKLFPSLVCSYVSLHALGILLTLLGTFIYAIQSVLCELMNSTPSLKVSAGELNGKIGWYGWIMSTVYVVVYTIPRWNDLVTTPMEQHHLQWMDVAWTLGLYLCANVFHRITYWSVVEQTGSIFAGLANALRTVTVFFLSSYLFCSNENTKQCLTQEKTYAAMAVVFFVVMYQLSSSGAKTKGQTSGSSVPIRVHGAHASMGSPKAGGKEGKKLK